MKVLWICVQDFERSRAFSFLNEVKKRFQTTYGSRAQTALPYAMNSEFSSTLAAQMVRPAQNHRKRAASNSVNCSQTSWVPLACAHEKAALHCIIFVTIRL